ncbi:CdaR family transcriptional regulator [Crassaminicella profunda]|uniref:CdaR family transcriptional regulator n=1 Tax=Crassaminicella profunda TaxID=1286698 RepID=UPI001CA77DF5|nr:sugar diacid recognition domain-containing protein [Crassaminicella profunda]QZY54428.1 helix-turn-helix domain-containing protein [Crassaminicella profunda]
MNFQNIAQKLVDATMKIIDKRNINIMDKNGFIIASGDKKRVNTFHKGADDVIKSNKMVEIYPEDVKNYPGAKEGVNMPINIQGKVLGVVGVYGHPNEVRIIAKLVKTSIELAFEQYLIAEQVKIVKDLKQQIIRKIIYEDVKEKEEEILCLCKIANLNMDKKRIGIIIKLSNDNKIDSAANFKSMREIEKFLVNSSFVENDDIIGIINEKFVILKEVPIRNFKNEKEYMKSVSRKIYEKCGLDVRIACGSLNIGTYGLKKSFFEAKALLRNTYESIQDINDLKTQTCYLLNQINDDELEHFIRPIYNKILNSEGKVEIWIINTLKALFENDLNINKTAKRLYLHKNSLTYRIKKIEAITGLSIMSNFNHSILLRLLTIYVDKNNKTKEEL